MRATQELALETRDLERALGQLSAEQREVLLLVVLGMTVFSIALGFIQLLFVANFFWSMFRGKKAEQNPWNANTLEWTTSSPAST
mgnify:CR=1 FL=1